MIQQYLNYIHYFNPLNLYTLIVYNGIMKKYVCSPIVQNTPFWTIISTFKTGYAISCYTPSHLKAYQQHKNFTILINNSLYKMLVKMSAFWFSDSIFQITNYFPTCFLKQWYLTSMWFDVGVILGLVATTMDPLCCSYTLELDTNFNFSLSIPKFSITSLIIIFKVRKSLTKWDNSTYS